MNTIQIEAFKHADQPFGSVVALATMLGKERLEKESQLRLVAERVYGHPNYGDCVSISAFHTEGENAGALSSRQIIIPNNEGFGSHTVAFLEFGTEYDLRHYSPIQIMSVALEAVYFLINGDLPEVEVD